MRDFDNSNHLCGDLALIQNIAQTYTEEIKNLLFIQYCMKTNQLELDFNEQIDIRLLTVSELNHLLVKQGSASVPKQPLQGGAQHKIEVDALLSQLKELNTSAQQNVELINSMSRFVKSKAIKRKLSSYVGDIKKSLDDLDEKEQWLSESIKEPSK